GEWAPPRPRAARASTARDTAGHASRGAAAASPTASANAITVWLLGKDQLSGGGHADTMSWRWQGRTSANRSLSSRFSPYARAAASPPATSPTRRRRRGDGDGVRRSTAKTPAAR